MILLGATATYELCRAAHPAHARQPARPDDRAPNRPPARRRRGRRLRASSAPARLGPARAGRAAPRPGRPPPRPAALQDRTRPAVPVADPPVAARSRSGPDPTTTAT